MPDLDRDWELLRQQLNAPYLVNAQGPLGRIYAAFQELQDTEAEVERLREALSRFLVASLRARAALIAVSGHLATPYPDDPRWTPWTRFGERATRELELASKDARAVLLQQGILDADL